MNDSDDELRFAHAANQSLVERLAEVEADRDRLRRVLARIASQGFRPGERLADLARWAIDDQDAAS